MTKQDGPDMKPREEDPMAPARGCLYGSLVALVFWSLLAALICTATCIESRAQELPFCGLEPQYAPAAGCPAPGPCAYLSGMCLSWTRSLDADYYRICDDYGECFDFHPITLDGPSCYRVWWPGVNGAIPLHRYYDRGGAVTITVEACNAPGCSDPTSAFIVMDPWYVPLQELP